MCVLERTSRRSLVVWLILPCGGVLNQERTGKTMLAVQRVVEKGSDCQCSSGDRMILPSLELIKKKKTTPDVEGQSIKNVSAGGEIVVRKHFAFYLLFYFFFLHVIE